MMNANSSSHNNLQFEKSNNPNHSNNTTDSNNPIYSHSHNLNDSNNVNHSNNPKDSNNSRNSHNCPSDSYNNIYNFHFPETPTSTYMNGIIQSFNTTPSSNASNDNIDIDAQMADAKEKLREGLLKIELADLYQELLLSSDEDTAEQPMEFQNGAGADYEVEHMLSNDRYPSFAGICNAMNNAMNNTNMDGDDITEEIVHDSEAKSEFLNDSYNIIYINNNENKNNDNKNQPNTLHPLQLPLQSPFKKNRKSHFKALHPPRPSHAEIDEMYNNMMDIKCNKCSKLMVHFVSSFDVYPELEGWECDGVGCTEETGKPFYEEIYHCDCIEDGYDLCQKCATAIMMNANRKNNENIAIVDMDDMDDGVSSDQDSVERICFVDSDNNKPQNNIVQSAKYTASGSNTKSQNKNRKRKRNDFHSDVDSLEVPPNKRRKIGVNNNNKNDKYQYCKILMHDNADKISPFTINRLRQMIVNKKGDSLYYYHCTTIAICNNKMKIRNNREMKRIIFGELDLHKNTGQPLKNKKLKWVEYVPYPLNGKNMFQCIRLKGKTTCNKIFENYNDWSNHKYRDRQCSVVNVIPK